VRCLLGPQAGADLTHYRPRARTETTFSTGGPCQMPSAAGNACSRSLPLRAIRGVALPPTTPMPDQ
jgi:hypothetical protein